MNMTNELRGYTMGDGQDYVSVLDAARQDAAEVLGQWEGLDIDWSDVESELRAHWSACDGIGGVSDEYIELVAREIGRIH